MTRLLILATIILYIVSYASAQIVDSLNTVLGPVTQGAKVAVTWSLLAGADATGKTGDLSATDSATKNVIPIDPAVPLAPKSYLWEVKVPPGTYTLGLNDGAGLKQSGEVVVKAPAGGVTPPPAAGPGKAPAPAPAPAPGTPAPAPAPGTPAPAPAPGAPATSGTPDTPSPPAGSPSTSTPGGATSPAPAASTGSASSIFSGYQVVFSLLGVAVAMVHF